MEFLKKSLRFLYGSRKTILLIVIVAVATIIISSLVAVWLSRTYNLSVPSLGTIYVTGVEVYGGDLRTQNGLVSIDWGDIQWGDSKSVSFYLRSTSTIPTRLGLNTTDWSPEALGNYMSLSWNYDGTQLVPQEEILVKLALTVSDSRDFANYLVLNNVKSYNFTVYIYTLK